MPTSLRWGSARHRPNQPLAHSRHSCRRAQHPRRRRQPRSGARRRRTRASGTSRAPSATTRRCSPIRRIDAVYIPLPNTCTSSGRCAARGPASTCCARSRWRSTPAGVDRDRGRSRARTGVASPKRSCIGTRRRPIASWRSSPKARSAGCASCAAAFSFPLTREDDVRLTPEWGGGALWDVGCYPVTTRCCWLAGRR